MLLSLVSNSLQAQAGSAASFLQSAAPGKVMKRKSDGVFYLKKKKKNLPKARNGKTKRREMA